MRAVRLYGSRDVRLETVLRPKIRPDIAIIKVAWAGICGTDLYTYLTPQAVDVRDTRDLSAIKPVIPGHEFSGVISDTTDSSNWPLGTRVVVDPAHHCGRCLYCRSGQTNLCRHIRLLGADMPGGLAEYVAVPLKNLIRLPNKVGLRTGCMVEPLSCAFHAVQRASLMPDERVLIMGGGAIGLGVAFLLRMIGVKRILLCEPSVVRRGAASQLGLMGVLDPLDAEAPRVISSRFKGQGASLVFETSGQKDALTFALPCVRKGGRVVVVGRHREDWLVPTRQVFSMEISLIWSLGAVRSDFRSVIDLVAACGQDLPFPVRCADVAGVSQAIFDKLVRGSVLKLLVRVDSEVVD